MKWNMLFRLINIFLLRPFLVDVIKDKEVIKNFILIESTENN